MAFEAHHFRLVAHKVCPTVALVVPVIPRARFVRRACAAVTAAR